MLEGKEVDVKIGEYGSASVDINGQGKVVLAVQIEVDLVKEAKKLAAKTGTPLDDKAIAWLELLMGLQSPPPAPEAA